MLGYSVKFETVTVGGFPYQIRSLADLQQYADPFGEAENMGISSASWPLFGHLWPSARILAQTMHSDVTLESRKFFWRHVWEKRRGLVKWQIDVARVTVLLKSFVSFVIPHVKVIGKVELIKVVCHLKTALSDVFLEVVFHR